jgi:hypothetical protein
VASTCEYPPVRALQSGRQFPYNENEINKSVRCDCKKCKSKNTKYEKNTYITSTGPAIHFHKTRPLGCHHDLTVGWSVSYSERVQYTSDVRDENLGFGRLQVDREASKVDKGAAVGGALVVDPYHHGFVHSVARYVVDDVLLAA